MKVIIIDDMLYARNMLVRILKEHDEIEFIRTFSEPMSAFEYIKENSVDLIFLDIEMPEINGIELISEFDKLADPPMTVFVTGYASYAINAWKTMAIGYILKPFNKEDIAQVIEKYKLLKGIKQKSLGDIEIKCFPGFDVFIDGKPIGFRSKKAKELLAYLVHNQGQWVNVNTICYVLMGDIDEGKAQNRVRSYLSRLRKELKEVGLGELIEQAYGKCRVNTKLFTCDYYRVLKGELSIFNGEYMYEYSWAEAVKEDILNKVKKM